MTFIETTYHEVSRQFDTDKKDTSIKAVITRTGQPKYHVDPVVSSSIPMRTFDEELESDIKSSKTPEKCVGDSGIAKVIASATDGPAFEEKKEIIKEINQQAEKYEDFTIVGMEKVPATEELSAKEKIENITEGEELSKQLDDVSIKDGILATDPPYMEKKLENSTERDSRAVNSADEANKADGKFTDFKKVVAEREAFDLSETQE